jgi:hypothetical protein
LQLQGPIVFLGWKALVIHSMFKIDNTTKVDFFHSVSVKGIKSECKEKKPVESPSFGSKASSDTILKMVFALPRFPPSISFSLHQKMGKKGKKKKNEDGEEGIKKQVETKARICWISCGFYVLSRMEEP